MLVIEHNLDVIKTADWIIDLGPEGGAAGGEVIATGTPEQVAQVARSYTGQFVQAAARRARRGSASGNGSAAVPRRDAEPPRRRAVADPHGRCHPA